MDRSKKRPLVKIVALLMLCPGFVMAQQPSLPERLMERYSDSWNQKQAELKHIDAELRSLPDIPTQLLGGTGGLLLLNLHAKDERSIYVRWPEDEWVDLVALIPARNLDSPGLDLEFGIPGSFVIDLLDRDGQPVFTVAEEPHAHTRPIQRGFPFFYSLPSPVKARGIRIHCRDPQEQFFSNGRMLAMAWSELFCFTHDHNVAAGASVTYSGTTSPTENWHWNLDFLTDGMTPLGLPEIPGKEIHTDIGWLSHPKETAQYEISVEIDFESPKLMDGISMFPAQRPTFGVSPGLGLPQRFRLDVIDPQGESRTILNRTATALRNPGDNPFVFRFPEIRAKKIRLVCPEIWTAYPHDNAFLGFSEIQILHGQTNIAVGAHVSVSDKAGKVRAHQDLYWDEQSLTDGFGPKGKLVSRREWLEELNQRLALETRQLQVEQEVEAIIARWRRNMMTGVSALTLIALMGLLVLPIRYRIHERRKLQQLRRRIADDLHDEVGANLGSIAGSTELLEEITENPLPKQQELMHDIANTAKKTASETRLLIHFLESKGVKGCLISQFNIAASQMLGGITYHQRYADDEAFNLLPPILKWDLLLFFKETLHNIVKHAEASEVLLKTSATRKQLQLSISDNGNGLPDGRQPTHLKSRAQRIGGRLETVTNSGTGTEILLTIPRERIMRWIKKSR